jgi:pimeloyl-ACP methyl ester carboxylesterase
LFLPGAHCHGEILFPSEQFDLRIYLAMRGVETWTLDYRTHFVPREQIYDSAFMQTWTTEAFVDDVLSAVQRVRETTGQQKVILGGFGLGATFATLAAARNAGEGIAGLVLLDGYVLDPPDEDPLYRERTPTPHWFADDLERHTMPYKRWIKILQDVIDNPAGPDFLPVPVFDNRAQALAHFLYVNANFGGQGGFSNAQNGKADVVMLARFLQHQDRYWPRVQNHGGFALSRHLANTQFDYEKAVRALRLPLLAFASDGMDKSGIHWSERVQLTAQAIASTQSPTRVLHDWGHLDVLMGSAAMSEVYRPIAEWILQQSK